MPAAKINVNDLEKAYNSLPGSDPDILLAIPKALELIRCPKTNPKTANGMKVLLYRFFSFQPGHPVRKQSQEMLVKWYEEKKRNDGLRSKEAVISTDDSPVKVLVVPTNEELVIAMDTAEIVSGKKST